MTAKLHQCARTARRSRFYCARTVCVQCVWIDPMYVNDIGYTRNADYASLARTPDTHSLKIGLVLFFSTRVYPQAYVCCLQKRPAFQSN